MVLGGQSREVIMLTDDNDHLPQPAASGHDRPVAFLLQSRCWAGALTRKQPFAWRCKFARAGGGFVEARPLEYRSATSVPSQDETVEPAVEISLTRAH